MPYREFRAEFSQVSWRPDTSAAWGREGRSFERLLAAKVNLAGFLQRLRACFRVPHFQLFWSEAYTLGTISVGRCFLLGGILPSGLFIGVHLVERITKLPDNLQQRIVIGLLRRGVRELTSVWNGCGAHNASYGHRGGLRKR